MTPPQWTDPFDVLSDQEFDDHVDLLFGTDPDSGDSDPRAEVDPPDGV